MTRRVVVIGGGQAGLATSRALQRHGLDHVVVDASVAAGSVWRSRWDSLRMFTPSRYASLPDHPMPGDPARYPPKGEVGAYLDDYEHQFSLPVEHGVPVTSLIRHAELFRLTTEHGREIEAHDVVVATGAFPIPRRPHWAGLLASTVTQRHTADYHNPQSLPVGTTLVVGGGNSGVQIAADLAGAGRDVHLALGSPVPVVPQRPLGVDLFTWLHRLHIVDVSSDTRLGRKMAANDEVIVGPGPQQLARQLGITLWPRAIGADHNRILFQDDKDLSVDVVVWATGFRTDHSWIDIDGAVDAHGHARHHLGQSPIPGLHYVGLAWQRSLASALLGGVGRDAQDTATRIARHRQPR